MSNEGKGRQKQGKSLWMLWIHDSRLSTGSRRRLAILRGVSHCRALSTGHCRRTPRTLARETRGRVAWPRKRRPRRSGEDAHAAELRPPGTAELVSGDAFELAECVHEGRLQQPRRLVDVLLGAALGLGDDLVDHAQLETVRRVR